MVGTKPCIFYQIIEISKAFFPDPSLPIASLLEMSGTEIGEIDTLQFNNSIHLFDLIILISRAPIVVDWIVQLHGYRLEFVNSTKLNAKLQF